MAVDKLVDSAQLDSDLTSVANAIRAKSGGSSQLAFPAGFVSAIQAIPSGGGGNFELIGTKVFSNLSEYTDTATAETLDTEINISNTDYAWGYVTITCDSAIESSNEWGMTVALFGRYTTGPIIAFNYQQKGSSTLSKAAMVAHALNAGQGVNVKTAVAKIIITRKGHASNLTKCRAGNYTVKVYGMTAI